MKDFGDEIGLEDIDEEVVLQVAKIIGTLDEKRIPQDMQGGPHKSWLLTEGFIGAGKDPAIVNEALLSSISGEKPKKARGPQKELKPITSKNKNEYQKQPEKRLTDKDVEIQAQNFFNDKKYFPDIYERIVDGFRSLARGERGKGEELTDIEIENYQRLVKRIEELEKKSTEETNIDEKI